MDLVATLVELPGVNAAVERSRAAIDELLRSRVLRTRSAEVSAESALRGARASAALEGADWTLAEIRAFDARNERAGASTVAAALRVSTELGRLASTWERAPSQVLARLHLVASSPADAARAGRPRIETVSGPDDSLDLPPAPMGGELTARLDALARLVTSQTPAPATVLAGVVHGELLALRPFPSANGLIARAAARLVLITRGVDPKAVSVPEVGYAESRDAYVGRVAAYLEGTPAGVGDWLVHCADAVTQGAREGLAVCEALRRG